MGALRCDLSDIAVSFEEEIAKEQSLGIEITKSYILQGHDHIEID